KLKKNGIIAEVGVLGGDFSEAILKACEPKELHLIDLFNCEDYAGKNRFTARESENYIRDKFKKNISEGIVHIHKGWSWEMLSKLPDDYFDCIYIDAGHDYESVKKDLKEADRCIKNDGI